MTAFFYDILFALPLSLAVTSLAGTLGGYDQKLLILLSAVVAVICALYGRIKTTWRFVLSGVIVAAVLMVLFLQKKIETGESLQVFAVPGLVVAITVALFFISIMLEHYRRGRAGVAVAGLVFLAASLFAGVAVTKLCVCMILLYAMLVLAAQYNRQIVFISPFLLVFFVAVAFVKVPEEPYDWGFVRAICESVKSAGVYIRENLVSDNPWNGTKTVIGFSDRGALGGDLYGSDRRVMELLSQDESDPMLYLEGKTFDTFDGKSWYKNNSGEFAKESFDVIETLCAARNAAGDDPVSDIVKRSWLKVRYREMHTGVMFYPAKAVFDSRDMAGVGEDGGDLSFLDRRDSRAPYDMVYYRLNRKFEGFLKMLNSPHEITEADWKEAAKNAGIKEGDAPGFSDYIEYKAMIRREYLSDITLSDDLSKYMEGLLRGADTDYEKLKRIEQCLSGFDYTDSPGDLPESIGDESDYLDYLFFEKRSGYCSYFATAFVLLARANGIPARYVQGYCVPMGIARRADVSSMMAHAWPEAYIEGVGWIAFEPTPGRENAAGWIISNGEDNTAASQEAIAGQGALQEQTDDGTGEESRQHLLVSPVNILASAGAGIAVILFLLILARMGLRMRYAGMSDRDKSLWLCRRNMELLKRIKPGRAGYETLMEYGKRLSESVPPEQLKFLKMYERMLYDDFEVTEADRIELEEAHRRLLIFVRKMRWERIRRILWRKKRVSLA